MRPTRIRDKKMGLFGNKKDKYPSAPSNAGCGICMKPVGYRKGYIVPNENVLNSQKYKEFYHEYLMRKLAEQYPIDSLDSDARRKFEDDTWAGAEKNRQEYMRNTTAPDYYPNFFVCEDCMSMVN